MIGSFFATTTHARRVSLGPTAPPSGFKRPKEFCFFTFFIFDLCHVLACPQVHKVVQATEHKPFNPKSDAHQAFLRKQMQKVDNLERKYPGLSLDDERGFFKAHILEPVAVSGP